nr:NADH dehydrogenase subunit 2 [Shaddai sp. SL-2021a]
MKLNLTNIMFFVMIMTGLLISMCSNNWLLVWCGLEISLISFMPLLTNKLMSSSESCIKYFIIQSISSAMLIMGMMLMLTEFNGDYLLVLVSALMIKMGVAPFHNWVLTVIESINIYSMFLMFTVMKIIPLMLLSYLISNILGLMVFITLITGSVMGLNQNSLRKILGYSSIYNMGFIISVMNCNFMWISYLFMYSVLVFLIVTIINNNFNFINQLMLNQNNMFFKISFWISLLSMGGMPPMLGFSIKLMVLEYMMYMNNILLMFIMIVTSLLVMFYYFRMMFVSILLSSMMPKYLTLNLNNLSLVIIVLNLFTLPLAFLLKSLI